MHFLTPTLLSGAQRKWNSRFCSHARPGDSAGGMCRRARQKPSSACPATLGSAWAVGHRTHLRKKTEANSRGNQYLILGSKLYHSGASQTLAHSEPCNAPAREVSTCCIVQVGKRRHKEAMGPAEGHTANQYLSQEQDSRVLIPRPVLEPQCHSLWGSLI